MWDRAIILAEMYDGDAGVYASSPRIIAPLQRLFEPIISAADFYSESQQWWWGGMQVPLSRFSVAPRIVFDRLPTLPENLAEAMLYHLQLRLVDSALFIRQSLPGLSFGTAALPGLDGPVTLLPV